ncbi:uncharacterized protein [Erythrolamprus reginae]|uniref:uncharacterized protein n=1 Tax=Erythrolamprus reginae TaxID=121349 RepID=UPI00396C4734
MVKHLATSNEWSNILQLQISTKNALSYTLAKRIRTPNKQDLSDNPHPVKDLGILKWPSAKAHCNNIVKKASRVVNLILRSFCSSNPTRLSRAYKTFTRPILEYSSFVWNPHRISEINTLENIQRYFTRRALHSPTRNGIPYTTRLTTLGLERIGKTSEESTFSPESNRLVFLVVDGLSAPLLKVDPLSQRVKEGDPLVFLCTMEGDNAEKKFHFYKDGVEITSSKEGLLEPSSEPTDPPQNGSLRIPHASFSHNGEFACNYEGKRHNPSIVSYMSKAVNITVEPDNLPSPVLKVDSFSQRVKESDPLVFLCSTEGENAEKKFHFYKDGVEITSSKEGLQEPSSEPTDPLQGASLRIPHASFSHNGEFACSYEEKRHNRWIASSLSQAVIITIESDSDPIQKYSWIPIPFIILLILLAFYWWKKRSTLASQEQFQLREKKEERNDLAVMEPQGGTAASVSPVKDSEVTCSNIQDSFIPSPPPLTKRNLLPQEEEEGITYSDIVFPPKSRLQNHL